VTTKAEKRAERARRSREQREARRAAQRTATLSKSGVVRGQPSQSQQPQPVKFRKAFWFGVLAAMTIIGGAYSLYELRPKVQISKAESLDPGNALETRFVVTNNSTFRIRSLKTSCGVNMVRATNGSEFTNFSIAEPATIEFAAISPGESSTVTCLFNKVFRLANSSISFADVVITAQYSYPMWWTRIESKSRFVTQIGKNGQLQWFPQPIQGEHSN
jgi:hypothetical protein